MIFNPRCAGVALLSLAMLGIAGCAEDNESSAKAQSDKSAAVKDNGPPPKDQREYFERQKKESSTQSKGYPGVK
jgi:hypothetical protein